MNHTVAILYALHAEVKPLLSKFRENASIFFHRTGIGMANAHEATEELLQCRKPALVVSVGFAGAARADLKTGDLVLATEIRSETPADRFVTHSQETARLEQCLVNKGLPFHKGPLKTLWKIADPSAKSQAGREGCVAVDMETAAIAAIVRKAGIPFVSLRVIFDSAREELPFKKPFDEKHPFRSLFQNPGVTLKIPRYALRNRICRKQIKQALTEFLTCL